MACNIHPRPPRERPARRHPYITLLATTPPKRNAMQLVRTSPLPSWPVDTTEPRKISSRHQHSTHSRTTLNGLCLVAVAVVWWSDKWKFIHQRNCNFHNRNLSNTRGYYREQEAYVHISWSLYTSYHGAARRLECILSCGVHIPCRTYYVWPGNRYWSISRVSEESKELVTDQLLPLVQTLSWRLLLLLLFKSWPWTCTSFANFPSTATICSDFFYFILYEFAICCCVA